MASLFPAIIHYEQDLVLNDMKQTQLEHTVNARKQQKSQVLQFTGDSVEMILYIGHRFGDTMAVQEIDARETDLW